MGQWNCKDLPCPGRCSLEGGSFVTTFDSRPYRFHGVCTYVLMKVISTEYQMDIFYCMWFPIGTQTEDFIRYTFILQIIVILTWLLFLLLFSVSLQSSSLPHNGTLMAVYEKTGYSHSETSLSAIIYQSAKVGIPSTGSIQDFITRLTK